MLVRLIKYQALGNDYLVLDLPGPLDELVKLLPTLCHPHFGLGSDGLLAFDPVARSVRIFNPDGSEAQKSGNGLRITAAATQSRTSSQPIQPATDNPEPIGARPATRPA